MSIEIASLPVGGMITRIACGSTIRRIVCRRVMPSDAGRVGLALVDRDDPGADDLRHVGALVEPEPEDRGCERRDQRVGVGVDERRAERDAERRSSGTARRGCTRTGAARARGCRGRTRCRASCAPDTSGLGERRMTASTTPSAMPIAIAITVSSSVTPQAVRGCVRRTGSAPTTLHSKRGFGDDGADDRDRDDQHDRAPPPSGPGGGRGRPGSPQAVARPRWPRGRTPSDRLSWSRR